MNYTPSTVSANLSTEGLWRKFNKYTTEMIVTKTGRKMFPKLEYIVQGLDPNSFYVMVLRMERVDDIKYKFSAGEWQTSGRGDTVVAPRTAIHHDGVLTGAQWMGRKVAFDRVRVTNNQSHADPVALVVQSMHKYIPSMFIYQVPSAAQLWLDANRFSPEQLECCQLITNIKFDFTQFIAVTAYQNQSVTNLKIQHNPFAKGFREGSERKRQSSSPVSSEEPSPKRSPNESPVFPTTKFDMSPEWFNYCYNPYLMNSMWYNMNMNPYSLPYPVPPMHEMPTTTYL